MASRSSKKLVLSQSIHSQGHKNELSRDIFGWTSESNDGATCVTADTELKVCLTCLSSGFWSLKFTGSRALISKLSIPTPIATFSDNQRRYLSKPIQLPNSKDYIDLPRKHITFLPSPPGPTYL
jgi:hypothetical protein